MLLLHEARQTVDTAFFVGRARYGPKFRKGYRYGLGYGFVVMGMGRCKSHKNVSLRHHQQMLKRSAMANPCGTPFLRHRNLLCLFLLVVKVKLQLPISSRPVIICLNAQLMFSECLFVSYVVACIELLWYLLVKLLLT